MPIAIAIAAQTKPKQTKTKPIGKRSKALIAVGLDDVVDVLPSGRMEVRPCSARCHRGGDKEGNDNDVVELQTRQESIIQRASHYSYEKPFLSTGNDGDGDGDDDSSQPTPQSQDVVVRPSRVSEETFVSGKVLNSPSVVVHAAVFRETAPRRRCTTIENKKAEDDEKPTKQCNNENASSNEEDSHPSEEWLATTTLSTSRVASLERSMDGCSSREPPEKQRIPLHFSKAAKAM